VSTSPICSVQLRGNRPPSLDWLLPMVLVSLASSRGSCLSRFFLHGWLLALQRPNNESNQLRSYSAGEPRNKKSPGKLIGRAPPLDRGTPWRSRGEPATKKILCLGVVIHDKHPKGQNGDSIRDRTVARLSWLAMALQRSKEMVIRRTRPYIGVCAPRGPASEPGDPPPCSRAATAPLCQWKWEL